MNTIKKITAITIYIILAIILVWFAVSWVEIACKNLTTQDYSDYNLIVWCMNYGK